MQESINLRRRIDDLQKKQNELLMTSLKQTERDETDVSSRRSSESIPSNAPLVNTDFSSLQSTQPYTPLNHFVLGSQTFDLQGALNLLLGTQTLPSPFSSLMPQNVQQPLYPYSGQLHMQENKVKPTQNQKQTSPTTLSKILNVLTKEQPTLPSPVTLYRD